MMPTVIIIASDIRQRHALKDVVQSYGFELLHCISATQYGEVAAALMPHLWVVDVEDEGDLLDRIGFDKPILFGLSAAPAFHQRPQYLSWKKKVGLKLLKMLGQPPSGDVLPSVQPPVTCLQHGQHIKTVPDLWRVVLLAGSMGGVESIKQFLDQLPSDLPICCLLVQHIDPYMQRRLPHILGRHNQWQIEMISAALTKLQRGVVYVVPAEQQVAIDAQGLLRLDSTPVAWSGIYQPSIHTMMWRASLAFKQQLLTIVFSGMGDDGSQAAVHCIQQGAVIWAQTADSCASPSQPDQVRATGKVSFNDTPSGLALQLTREYGYSREKNDEQRSIS